MWVRWINTHYRVNKNGLTHSPLSCLSLQTGGISKEDASRCLIYFLLAFCILVHFCHHNSIFLCELTRILLFPLCRLDFSVFNKLLLLSVLPARSQFVQEGVGCPTYQTIPILPLLGFKEALPLDLGGLMLLDVFLRQLLGSSAVLGGSSKDWLFPVQSQSTQYKGEESREVGAPTNCSLRLVSISPSIYAIRGGF